MEELCLLSTFTFQGFLYFPPTKFNIPKQLISTYWASGQYKATIDLKSPKANVGCIELYFSIEQDEQQLSVIGHNIQQSLAECVIPSPNYPALLLPHPLPQLCSMFILILSDFSSQKSLHFKTNNIFGLTRVLSDSVKCQFHFLLDCLLKSTLTCFYFSFVGSGIAEQSYVGYVLCPMLNRWVSSSGAAGFLPLSSTASRGLPKRCQGISSIPNAASPFEEVMESINKDVTFM